MKSFWKVCLNLEDLELASIYVSFPPCTGARSNSDDKKNGGSLGYSMTNKKPLPPFGSEEYHWAVNTPTLRFPKLKKLDLHGLFHAKPLEQLHWFIGLCPMLNTLRWSGLGAGPPPLKEFARYLAAMTWPELDSITIKGWNEVSDKEYAVILQAAQRPLKVLDLNLRCLGADSFTLLRQSHFKTLTKVNLLQAKNSTSDPSNSPEDSVSGWVQEVLESCPSLERIVARIITAQDIMNGQPWVCLRLEEFKVMIDMEFKGRALERGPKRPKYTEDEENQCRAIYGQLGRLTQLRSLNMHYWSWSPDRNTIFPLPLELRVGLGQLCRLKDIERIDYYGSQDMRMVDLEWMLQHWPHLQLLHGDRLSDKRSKTFGNLFVRHFLLSSTFQSQRVGASVWARNAGDTELRLVKGTNGITDFFDSDSDDSDSDGSELQD